MDAVSTEHRAAEGTGNGNPSAAGGTNGSSAAEHTDRGPLSTDELAAVIGRDIPAGAYVNLGIGQPTKIADHLPTDSGGHATVILHTENGMLGMGPAAVGDDIDPDLTNAGKVPVTELPGAAYFHHADSFAMMRGGHLDVCVLGAYQVSAAGDLANWHTGKPDDIPAVGGAMDLAIGAKDVYVMMTLFTKKGDAKLVPECSYPLTGVACVSRVYTDYAVFDLQPDGVRVLATYGISLAELRDRVGVPLLG
jgi:3-oxoadipate CoA-transferase beta subunit